MTKAEAVNVEVPTIGRVLHYYLGDIVDTDGTKATPQWRPALVVRPTNEIGGSESPLEMQLQVYVDGANDLRVVVPFGERTSKALTEDEATRGLAWRTSIAHFNADDPKPGTWRWPPRADAPKK